MTMRGNLVVLLESMAQRGEIFRSGDDLARKLALTNQQLHNLMGVLRKSGAITGGTTEGITLRTGRHAGTTIYRNRNIGRPSRAKPPGPRRPPQPAPPAPLCAWCEDPHQRQNHGGDYGYTCSRECNKAWQTYRITRRQYEARRAHLAQQPKGCATIAEFLAAGGVIYREGAAA